MRSPLFGPSEQYRPALRRAAAVAVAGAALTLVALMFDASPLFVPGVAFMTLGLITPAWIWIAARGATVTRVLHGDRVVEEEPVEATISVRRGLLWLPGAEVDDPLAGASVSLRGPLSLISGSRSASVRVIARFSTRGRKHVDPPRLIVTDVLDLARFIRPSSTPTQELLVLPRTEPVRWTGRDLGGDADPAAGRATAEPLAAVELDGLRPYRVGTPASRIHWPALARGAGLLERRLRADADTSPLIVLDSRSTASPELLDDAVRAAASLVLELARRGGCGLLLPGERRPIEIGPDLGGWPAAHARLALVEGGPNVRPPQVSPGSRLGRIFYVTPAPLQRLPEALTRTGHMPGVLVVPTAAGASIAAAAAFEVSGCVGYVIGAARRERLKDRAA